MLISLHTQAWLMEGFYLQYGYECWCGKTLNNPQTSTKCSMACAGDSSAVCGNSETLNLYTYTATAPASLGCYVDMSSARTLGTRVYVGSLNTPAYCISQCKTSGFAYAGVEVRRMIRSGKVKTDNPLCIVVRDRMLVWQLPYQSANIERMQYAMLR